MVDLKFYRSYYDDFYGKGDFKHYPDSINRTMLAVLQKRYFSLNQKILDIGCGTGVQMYAMKLIGMHPFGIDLSHVGLCNAKSKFLSNVFVQADALRLPFAESTFDSSISFGCSLMNGFSLDVFRSFISEGLRVVKKSGWFVGITRSNFSGDEISGWKHLTMNQFYDISTINCHKFEMIVTLPKLFPSLHGFALSKIVSKILHRIPMTRSRVVILAFQK